MGVLRHPVSRRVWRRQCNVPPVGMPNYQWRGWRHSASRSCIIISIRLLKVAASFRQNCRLVVKKGPISSCGNRQVVSSMNTRYLHQCYFRQACAAGALLICIKEETKQSPVRDHQQYFDFCVRYAQRNVSEISHNSEVSSRLEVKCNL